MRPSPWDHKITAEIVRIERSDLVSDYNMRRSCCDRNVWRMALFADDAFLIKLSTLKILNMYDLPQVSSSWSFSSSRALASCSWEVPVCSTDFRRHWMKRSRKSVPLLGSCATNLSTFSAWVACSVNCSWKSAVIRWYWLRYGRRLGTFSSLLNLTWQFWRTLSPTEPSSERWNRCYHAASYKL